MNKIDRLFAPIIVALIVWAIFGTASFVGFFSDAWGFIVKINEVGFWGLMVPGLGEV